jgi:hypothetical protein
MIGTSRRLTTNQTVNRAMQQRGWRDAIDTQCQNNTTNTRKVRR